MEELSNSSLVTRILAIDPGKTIGYALAETDGTTLWVIEVSQFVTEDWNPVGSKPFDYMALYQPDIVRIEDFVGNGVRSSESNHVLKMIGGFKSAADTRGIEFKQCAPGTRMKYLKKGGDAYTEATGKVLPIHAKDAWAHLLRECADLGYSQLKIEKL